MKIIGLCGGSGSGKTTVSDIFRDFGFLTVDTDAIYHELTSAPSSCLTALTEEFGREILTDENALDRRRLAAIVFADGAEDKRLKLNEISHFYVLARVREIISSCLHSNIRGVAVDVPLLFESNFDKECDKTVAVVADREKRIGRICLRDGISRTQAEARINSQLQDEFLIKNCDYVITNDGDISYLVKRVEEIIADLQI